MKKALSQWFAQCRMKSALQSTKTKHSRDRRNEKFRLVELESRIVPAGWLSYGGDAQHTAISSVASHTMTSIRWQTPVDLNPQYVNGDILLIHYGSPIATPANTVIVPVKTGATDGFKIEGHDGATGALKWTEQTDYILPPHAWTPSYSPTLTAGNRLYFAGAGGTVYYRDQPDANGPATTGQLAFFGLNNYLANKSAYDQSVFINTPITADNAGNIYFGFFVTGANPLSLESGIARIAADGTGTFTSAKVAAGGDLAITKVAHNSAPALSADGQTLYFAVNAGNGSSSFGTVGDLVSVNSQTLAPIASVRLKDPKTGLDASISEDASSSPTVGPNGDVFFGVLESSFGVNDFRGWLLHFSANLTQTAAMVPGAFGWDDTPSIVPASMVPSYAGTSQYLVMTKYNHYAGLGFGDGVNKLAILDPNALMVDPVTGINVMKEVLTVAGVTPDSEHPEFPNAVREWCINTAAVDPATKSILANCEDGKMYRWDLTTNQLTQAMTLTAGVGEAYTPTIIAPDGTVFAINNAMLFALGLPSVSIAAGQNTMSETGGSITVTATLATVAVTDVTINLGFSGSATLGQDFQASGTQIVIPAGSLTGSITVNALADDFIEVPESIMVDVTSVTNGLEVGVQQAILGITNANGRILNGTAGDDVISIQANGPGSVIVNFNFFAITTTPNGTLVINGLDGNDSISMDAAFALAVSVDGGNGNDTIATGAGADTITCGAGNDLVFAMGGNDLISGGSGNDGLEGRDGNDTILGEVGVDYIVGGDGDDSLLGGDDADGFDAGAGNDFIDGGLGNDFAYGFAGNDTILGQDGADGIDAGAGDDSIDAGAGDDFMYGIDGNDTLIGGDGNDGMDGGLGNDSMLGGAGNDLLFGNFGNDFENGGAGNDSIDGNAGNDTLDGSTENDLIFASGGGFDLLLGNAGNDTLQNIDANATLFGGAGNDVLYGANFTNDSLIGDDGNDTFFGLSGNDTITTGAGSDTVDGGAGTDFVTDASAQDVLFNVP